jgi:hypothetical protein
MKRWLTLAIALLVSVEAQAGLILEGSSDSLEVVTSAAGSVDYQVSWSNVTATALTTPGTGKGNINAATTTTVLSAPAASNFRHVRGLWLRNVSTTTTQILTVQVDVSATNRVLHSATLGVGETLLMDEEGEWHLYTASGAEKRLNFADEGITGTLLTFAKVATAVDAAGYHYAYMKDTGFPGAWTPGTPGLNGVATDCSSAAGATTMGAPVLPNPSGSWFLTRFGVHGSVVGSYELMDMLWYNTGIVVTTTTAQAITFPGLPARDLNGSANGAGVLAALYTTTANTNAAVISNTTLSYTDQDGNAGNTAVLSGAVGFQTPATPVLGTWTRFLLAAGDTGIRSVQSITLGTSYGAGALSLVLYRPLAGEGISVANYSSGSFVGSNAIAENPGVRIYNGTCFGFQFIGAPATTAPSMYGGSIRLMDR